MLSEDITGTLGASLRMAGAVIRGTARGAVIGAALLIGAAVVAAAAPPLLGMAGVGAATGGLSAAVAGAGNALMATFTSGAGLAALGAAAKLGAIVLGVTSVIPSLSDMRASAKHRMSAGESVQVDSASPAMDMSRGRAAELDNPYYAPGKGAQLMQKGDNAQQSLYR